MCAMDGKRLLIRKMWSLLQSADHDARHNLQQMQHMHAEHSSMHEADAIIHIRREKGREPVKTRQAFMISIDVCDFMRLSNTKLISMIAIGISREVSHHMRGWDALGCQSEGRHIMHK